MVRVPPSEKDTANISMSSGPDQEVSNSSSSVNSSQSLSPASKAMDVNRPARFNKNRKRRLRAQNTSNKRTKLAGGSAGVSKADNLDTQEMVDEDVRDWLELTRYADAQKRLLMDEISCKVKQREILEHEIRTLEAALVGDKTQKLLGGYFKSSDTGKLVVDEHYKNWLEITGFNDPSRNVKLGKGGRTEDPKHVIQIGQPHKANNNIQCEPNLHLTGLALSGSQHKQKSFDTRASTLKTPSPTTSSPTTSSPKISSRTGRRPKRSEPIKKSGSSQAKRRRSLDRPLIRINHGSPYVKD